MEEIILKQSTRIKIAINHYKAGNRDSVLIICPGCFICKDAKAFRSMSDDFFKHRDVITMDFRGHGRSSGFFTFTANEYLDLRTVIEYAKKQYKRIDLIGFSLGAATVILYAAMYKDVDSVIAVSPPVHFRSIENHFWKRDTFIAAINSFEIFKKPFIRPGNILLRKVGPLEVVADVAPIPLFIITGDSDKIVYPWHGQKLYDTAKEPKKFHQFQPGMHAELLYLHNRDAFVTLCKDWLLTNEK